VNTPSTSCAAGVYTSPILLPLVAHLLESFDSLDKLENFVSGFGRNFYRRPASQDAPKMKLVKTADYKVPTEWKLQDDEVIAFMAGKSIGWKLVA
jgi:dihydroorotase